MPAPRGPLVDLAALGDRLRRWRVWRGYSQTALARLAGVDPMVISRLEGQQKPRLEVETAARLARVCGWSLDQTCGLAPVPALPEPLPPASPFPTDMPAWLARGVPTSTEDRTLGAHILAWQLRGATLTQIATQLIAWGVQPFGARRWNREQVQACHGRYTRGTKTAKLALLREYGFAAEARQLAGAVSAPVPGSCQPLRIAHAGAARVGVGTPWRRWQAPRAVAQ
jgi:transcriptional regulator with XRE-family HTH domain